MPSNKKTTTTNSSFFDSAAFSGKFAGNYEDVMALGQTNLNAMFEQGSAFSKSAQDMSALFLGFAQATMTRNAAASKAMMGCTTVSEVVGIQSDLARENADLAVKEGRKLADLTTKLSDQALEQISTNARKAAEKLTDSLAA